MIGNISLYWIAITKILVLLIMTTPAFATPNPDGKPQVDGYVRVNNWVYGPSPQNVCQRYINSVCGTYYPEKTACHTYKGVIKQVVLNSLGEPVKEFYHCAGENADGDRYVDRGEVKAVVSCPEGSKFNTEKTACVKDNLDETKFACTADLNPIHLHTGNKVEHETDYLGDGVFPLRFTRIYNSGLPSSLFERPSFTEAVPGESTISVNPNVTGGSIAEDLIGNLSLGQLRDRYDPNNPDAQASGNDRLGHVHKGFSRGILTSPMGVTVEQYYTLGVHNHWTHQHGQWNHNYNKNIRVISADGETLTGAKATLMRGDNTREYFYEEDGKWVAEADNRASLERDSSGLWTYTDANGGIETYSYNGIYAASVLRTIQRNGHIHSLEYDETVFVDPGLDINDPADDIITYEGHGQLTSVSDAFGRALEFGYDSHGRLKTMSVVESGINRGVYTYFYDDEIENGPQQPYGNLVKVVYPDDTPGNLENNPTREYHYELAGLPGGDGSQQHFLTGITNENGVREKSWSYENGKAVSSTHALGTTDSGTVEYDSAANTATVTELGVSRTVHFENKQGVAKISRVDGPRGLRSFQQSTYDDNGNRDVVTDYNGNTTDYDFGLDPAQPHNFNREVRRIEAVGAVDEAGNSISRKIVTQWHQHDQSHEDYPNGYGLRSCVIEPLRTVMFEYYEQQPHERLLKQRTEFDTSNSDLFAPGDYNSRSCDAIKARTDIEKRSWFYDYYTNNLLKSVNGPLLPVVGGVDDITSYEYHPGTDKLSTVTNALGHQTTINEIVEQDAEGNPLKVVETTVDPNGLETIVEYSLLGWVEKISRGKDGIYQVTDPEYDSEGNMIGVTLPNGQYFHYHYDEANRMVGIYDDAYTVDAETGEHLHTGNHMQYELDNHGNPTAIRVLDAINALSYERTNTYDALGQMSSATGIAKGADTQSTRYYEVSDTDGYDGNGNRLLEFNAQDNERQYRYDGLDRLTHVVEVVEATTDPLGNEIQGREVVTKQDYDSQGRVIKVTDPLAHETTYDYNGLGDLLKLTSPDTGVTTYTYDAAGNVETKLDANGFFTGYVYDALNRLTHIGYPDGSLTVYDYDLNEDPFGKGRLGRVSNVQSEPNKNTVTEYRYDVHGRRIEERQMYGAELVTQYDYAPGTGQLNSITYPSGKVVSYGYYPAGSGHLTGLLESITADGVTLVSAITYQPFGPAKSWTWGNGEAYDRTFDGDGLVASYSLGNRRNESNELVALWEEVGYNNLGLVDTLAEQNSVSPSNTRDIGYDRLQRLNDYQGPDSVQTYSYDDNGNRVSHTEDGVVENYTIDPDSNRLQFVAGTAYAYDNNGNIIYDGRYHYDYDERNRMVKLRRTINAQSEHVTEYHHDGLGQRVGKLRYLKLDDQQGGEQRQFGIFPGNLIVDLVVDRKDLFALEYYLKGQEYFLTQDEEVLLGIALLDCNNDGQFTAADYEMAQTLTCQRPGSHAANFFDPVNTGLNQDDVLMFGAYISGLGDQAYPNADCNEDGAIDEADKTCVTNLMRNGASSQVVSYFAYNSEGKLLGEYGLGPLAVQETVYLGDQPIGMMRTVGDVPELYYIYADHLNTPRAISNNATAPSETLWRWLSDPFGTTEPDEDVDGDGLTLVYNPRFPGQTYDRESGLHYNYFRDYNPATGRYVESDPQSDEVGLAGKE